MPFYTATSTYDQPVLVYPTVSGLTISGILPANITIPLELTTYSVPSRKLSTVLLAGMPHTLENYSIGGNAVAVGGTELAKITIDGHIDTPTQISGTLALPYIQLDGIRYTYADIIAGFIDGRLTNWTPQRPSYFRDPYGRRYDNPQVLDFSASYVEAVPGRTNFSMVLVLNG